jgi:hypothetical protein
MLAANPRFTAGDTPGFFGVLHTWGRQLRYHPHIHYVVPGGMLESQGGGWRPCAVNFFLPVQALSRIVRAKFRDRMRKRGCSRKSRPRSGVLSGTSTPRPSAARRLRSSI